MQIVYYDHHGPRNQPGFRGGGSAWWVGSDPERPWDEHFAEFDISEPLYWAIFHLGIIDDFYELPHDGLLGAYEEGILLASALADASKLLRERAGNLTEATYEWSCAKQMSPDEIEFKIRVDDAALRQELFGLADFFNSAESQGFDVQLWL